MSTQALNSLGDLSRALTEAINDLSQLEQENVKAEGAFKVQRAKELLSAEGSVASREAQADIATEDLRTAFKCAEAKVRVQREHIRALHARIEVGRTYVATERSLAGVAM